MTAYYNEIEPFAADWLRTLIARGLIAPGDVDTRSIIDVRPDDLRSYTQCHFFAGIGGWSHALRSAGWRDDRSVWTGSCPCQPFSLAGNQKGFDDDRHLWPVWRELIRQCDPAVVFGEQVASAPEWLGLVRSDLGALGYAVGCLPMEAASAGADHRRDRFWFVAVNARRALADASHAESQESQGDDRFDEQWPTIGRRQFEPPRLGAGGRVDDGADPARNARSAVAGEECGDDASGWIIGADGKARRIKPGLRLLDHEVPGRVGKLRGFGNAIDPRPAKEFIAAFLEAENDAVAAHSTPPSSHFLTEAIMYQDKALRDSIILALQETIEITAAAYGAFDINIEQMADAVLILLPPHHPPHGSDMKKTVE